MHCCQIIGVMTLTIDLAGLNLLPWFLCQGLLSTQKGRKADKAARKLAGFSQHERITLTTSQLECGIDWQACQSKVNQVLDGPLIPNECAEVRAWRHL